MISTSEIRKYYHQDTFNNSTLIMKKAIILYIIFLSVLWPANLSAQSLLQTRADLLYENLSFRKASTIYESLYKRHPENGEIIQRLAYCYNKMLNYKKALIYYSYLVKIDEKSAVDYYEYAQLLRINGKVDEAKIWLEKYIQLEPNDKRAINQYNQIIELITFKDKFNNIDIKKIKGNTRFTDMAPAYYNDQLVYSSAKDSFTMIRDQFKWNGQPFLKLYVTNPNSKIDFNESAIFSKKLNTRVHEGPVCFTSDYKTIFYTRNSTSGIKNKKGPNGVNNLKIFVSSFDGKEWSEPENFPYNSDEYSVGHPALSPDNNTLYFISDMPGGYGETDIYKSELVQGQWSTPKNLGSTINTEGKEIFPSVNKFGILYFSSDGRPGLAGLDIYAAKSDGNGQYLIADFGSSLNSKYDDFGFIVNTDSMSGYFTSNRPGGEGDDDIYSFTLNGIDLQVTCKVENTNKILPFTEVYLIAENGNIITSEVSDKDGVADFSVQPGQNYNLLAENNAYVSDLKPVNISRELFGLVQKEEILFRKGSIYLTIKVIDKETGIIVPMAIINNSDGKYDESTLNNVNGLIHMKMNESTDYSFNVNYKGYYPNILKFSTSGKAPGEYVETVALEKLVVGKQFTLQDLFYDLDKSNIRPDAALVLNDLALMLFENPEVRIEIGSHTDSRATANYNMKLSQRRSVSVVAYLISKGISPNQLVPKGFGESQLINKCADGIDCTETEHQANRRTVITILKLDCAIKIITSHKAITKKLPSEF